jgi:hypothetical protein
MKGDILREHYLHRKFYKYHVSGEWFKKSVWNEILFHYQAREKDGIMILYYKDLTSIDKWYWDRNE